jgi:hypothetical protein
MTGISKRMIAVAVAAVAVLGTAGVALAAVAPAARPSYGLEETALALAGAEPDPAAGAAAAAGGARAKREELQACVKPKVDGGADRREALRQCTDQLGIKPGGAGRPGRPGGGGRPGVPGGGGRPGPAAALGRAAHADLIVPKRGAEGQWETIQVDRGKVTAVSAETISLQRPDGPTVTLKVVAATRLQGAEKVTDLVVGRQVVVVSAGGEARSIVARR